MKGRGAADDDPVAAARSEVERCRSAAWTDPVSFASALDQLASRLSGVGRHDERLTAIDESTAIWRELTAADPETALPGIALPERDSAYAGLAWALENRAYVLSDLDRHEEAVDPIVEAVAIRRRLGVSDSVRSESALAGALRSQSNMMRRVGRLHDALAAAEEAVAVRRMLVVSDAAYRPHLARALEALGRAHFEAERWGEAVSAFEEAVAVLRQFAEWEPDGMHDLAVALGLLARSRARAGQDGDAAVSQEECVSVLRAIVRAGARELRPWLAQELDDLAYRMGCAERWTEVVAPLREALDIRRELAEEDSDARLPELADLLVTLASALWADRQDDEARALVREAIEILTPLGERDPDRYAEVLDRALELRHDLR